MFDGPPISLDLLVALEVLLAERHVTRAAKRLGITQGAASQKLALLRLALGDPLLVPGRPLLVLTPRAQAIASPLSRSLRDVRAAIRVGQTFDPAVAERRFVLLGNDLVEGSALPSLVGILASDAPNVTLSVERADLTLNERLENGTADGAFLPDSMIGDTLLRLAVPAEPFVVLMRRGHPAARGKLTLERYLALAHLLVAPRGLPGSTVDSALDKMGKRRRVQVRVQHFLTAPLVVAQSELVVTCPAIVHRTIASWLPIVARTLPIDLPIDRSSFVWHRRSQDDLGHRWLRARIEQIIKSNRRAAR